MASATDIPGVYDLVINGQGYILLNSLAPDLPFRTQRAAYGITPTFVERTNVGPAYGDDQQSFWQTAAQNDWSLGEGQRFLRLPDADSKRRYWAGSALDSTSIEGQLTVAGDRNTLSFGATVLGALGGQTVVYTVSATNLYAVAGDGTIVNKGAHGAAVSGTPALCSDGSWVYISSPGSTVIRKFNIGSGAFSDFCATQRADALCFNNNTIFSVKANSFYTHDSAGVPTSQFTFKTGEGTTNTLSFKLSPYGGKVLLFAYGIPGTDQLYIYDSSGVSKVTDFPLGFKGNDMAVAEGIVFIAGLSATRGHGARTEIHYWANGNIGRLWASPNFTLLPYAPVICAVTDGIAFTDNATTIGGDQVKRYHLSNGAVTNVGGCTSSDTRYLAACVDPSRPSDAIVLTYNSATGDQYFRGLATSGILTTSLIDFESSLTKLFRGVTVDFVPGGDGNGGSVDIAYKVGALDDTAYTSLATGITSGQENLLTGVSGRSISFQITINRGTSILGPVMKRLYLRAAPLQQTFRNNDFIIDCTGKDGKTPVMLRNGNPSPLEGMTMATNLRNVALSTTPVTITDRFGTFTGIIEPQSLQIIEVRPEEFYVRCSIRQI